MGGQHSRGLRTGKPEVCSAIDVALTGSEITSVEAQEKCVDMNPFRTRARAVRSRQATIDKVFMVRRKIDKALAREGLEKSTAAAEPIKAGQPSTGGVQIPVWALSPLATTAAMMI